MPANLHDDARSEGDDSNERSNARFARLAFSTKRVATLLAAASVFYSAPAVAQKVRITGLSDINFGILANLTTDVRLSQSICVYSQSINGGYNVRGSGSGPGGAFALSSGTETLPYEVHWNSASGQTVGSAISVNTAQSGFTSAATHQTCNSGPASSASLIVVLRGPSLAAAISGSYTGTLTLVVAPE